MKKNHICDCLKAVLYLTLFSSVPAYAFFDVEGIEVNVEVNADLQKFKEGCTRIKEASRQLSDAARDASGNLKEGMESLSGSLNNVAQMPDKFKALLPDIQDKCDKVIANAEKSAKSVVNEFHSGNKANIKFLSDEFRSNMKDVVNNAETSLKNVMGDFHKGNKANIDHISQKLEDLISLANGKLKKRLQQIQKDLKETIDDVFQRLEKLEKKIMKDFNKLVDKVNSNVNGWLDRIDKMTDDKIRKVADELTIFAGNNEKLVNLMQEVAAVQIGKVDDATREKIFQAEILFERLRRGKWNFNMLGMGSTEGTPSILGTFPGSPFEDRNAQRNVTIYAMNFAEQGKWSACIVDSQNNKIPVNILGEYPGLEQIRVSGDFITSLNPDKLYQLVLEKQYTKEQTTGILSRETKSVDVKESAYCFISRRKESVDIDLEVWIKDTKGNPIYPPDPFPELKINSYHKWTPIFTIEAGHLPENVVNMMMRASLRNPENRLESQEVPSNLVTLSVPNPSVNNESYAVELEIRKKDATIIFKESKWVTKEKAKRLLADFQKKESSEDILTYLSLRSSLYQSDGDYVRYFEYSISPKYVLYMQVGKK